MNLKLSLAVTPSQAPTRPSAVATYKSDDHFTSDFESDEDEDEEYDCDEDEDCHLALLPTPKSLGLFEPRLKVQLSHLRMRQQAKLG